MNMEISKNILITGINGFAGSHLAELLLGHSKRVFGTVRLRSNMDNLSAFVRNNAELIECELTDAHAVRNTLIGRVNPDVIYHLAAQSFVPKSWSSPADTMHNNIVSQLNIFEALRSFGMYSTIVVIAGSSEEYGLVHEHEAPIAEDNPLRPLSPYAVSKVAQDMLGYQYAQSYKMPIIRCRAFNHEGPRRGQDFVISNFAKQIASIESGLQEPVISVGNLDARRDFTDVRDTVRAYAALVHETMENGLEFGQVYNICSGRAWRIGDMLDMLLGMSTAEIEIKHDENRMRPSDVPLLLGNCDRLKEATGWVPEIPFERTLRDTLDYWRGRVREAAKASC